MRESGVDDHGQNDSSRTVGELITALEKLPRDAQVVTSISGWEGPDLGPVFIKKLTGLTAVDLRDIEVELDGRDVYCLDSPA